MVLICYQPRKLEINKLDMLFEVPFLMNFFIFIVNLKLQKKFGMQWIKKCILEYARTQKYVIRNFRNFQMTEDRDVWSQIHDYHLLINDLAIEDIKLPEPFVASYLVETLPESWRDYKNNMKHKRK